MAQHSFFSVETENTHTLKLGLNVCILIAQKAHTEFSAVNGFKMFIIIASWLPLATEVPAPCFGSESLS